MSSDVRSTFTIGSCAKSVSVKVEWTGRDGRPLNDRTVKLRSGLAGRRVRRFGLNFSKGPTREQNGCFAIDPIKPVVDNKKAPRGEVSDHCAGREHPLVSPINTESQAATHGLTFPIVPMKYRIKVRACF